MLFLVFKAGWIIVFRIHCCRVVSRKLDSECCASFGLTPFSGTCTDVGQGGTTFPLRVLGVEHVACDSPEDCEQGDVYCVEGNSLRRRSSDECAGITVCHGWTLRRSNFIDPYACDEWIVLCDFFCNIEVFGLDNVVAGDRIHSPR